MGTVSLPSLDAILQIKDPQKQVEEFVNTVGILIKNLSEINGYLSSKNIKAQSIQTESLAAGSITADTIAVGAVTADKIDVDQLSAITADMGKLTSGEIYGAYIATAEGAYPRAEMSSVGDFFRALASASIYTEITPSFGGAPAIHSTDGVTTGLIQTLSLLGGTFLIASTADIDIRPGSGKKISVPSWSQIYSGGENQTLADALNNLATAISLKATSGVSTGGSGGHNHGIPNGTRIATTSDGTTVDGSFIWSVASNHTHAQT